jgi:hypothetical protein
VPPVEVDESVIWSMLSEPRMAPYLEGAAGDKVAALGLYEWSARTSSAAFEVVGILRYCSATLSIVAFRSTFARINVGSRGFCCRPLVENMSQMPWPSFAKDFGPNGKNPGTRSSQD